MPTTYTDAIKINKNNSQQTQGTEKTIYIGVFFDGTGNNKFQVMMGKLFRSKEAITKYTRNKNLASTTIADVRKKGRKYWIHQNPCPFTKSQLDEIFFGYDNLDSSSDMYFVEDSVHPAALVGQYEPIQDEEAKEVKEQMNVFERARNEFKRSSPQGEMSEVEWRNLKKYEGGATQESTYTNVAILESVYKTEQDYFPIYVEGAGTSTDMNKGGTTNWGAMTGRAGKGVWTKVEKAANAVSRIAERYLINESISKLIIKMSSYGFSRGATEARIFSFVFDPNNNNENIDKVLSKINNKKFLRNPKITKELNFVGIFDTVASVLNNDTDDLKLYGVEKAERVVHLCAMDEYRSHFPLTDISSAYGTGLELFMPGCHTDIGGGVSLGVDSWRQIDNYKVSLNPVYKAGLAVGDSIKKQSFAPMNDDLNDTCYMSKWNRNNRADYARPTVSVLKEMGWIPPHAIPVSLRDKSLSEDVEAEKYGAVFENSSSWVAVRKYVVPGYTNIALQLMRKAVDDCQVMRDIPKSYAINNSDLTKLYNNWVGLIGCSGQQFVSLTDSQYKHLRAKFLHYSGNDKIVSESTSLVNSVEYERLSKNELLITRLIYVGQKGKGNNNYYYLSHRN